MNAFEYTVEQIIKRSIKHEVHKFPSGAIMLDVWIEDLLYVFHFDGAKIGLTEVNDENAGLTTVPDETFYDFEKFKERLALVLNQVGNS